MKVVWFHATARFMICVSYCMVEFLHICTVTQALNTLSWEWRVFFPVEPSSTSDSILDVWSLLQPRDRVRGSPERRSDVYIKCTHGAGLKVRGGRLIEVKLRSTRDTVNGTELWQKVVSSHVRWDGRDVATLCAQFRKELEKEKRWCTDPGLLSSLEEAMSFLSSPHQQLVELQKERHTKSLNRVSVEQTDITVGDSTDGETSKWRSIAVEGTQKDIVKFLETKVHQPGSGGGEMSLGEHLRTVGGEPQGYAQFVVDLPQVGKPGSLRGRTDTEPQCNIVNHVVK